MSLALPSTGLVLRIDAKLCHVDVGGTVHALPLRGKLFEGRRAGSQPVAVGDRVLVSLPSDGDGDGEEGGAIEERLERTSKLVRTRRGEENREHVLAANVSLVLVTASISQPEFQPQLVDRILAGAQREHIAAVLVLTKTDRDRKSRRGPWVQLYRDLGYEVFETSVTAGKETEPALAAVRELLRANVTVLCGASGVGKSSLINHLCPGLDLRVGSISRIYQGKHTTTHTQLIALPGGGHVLDTPGIRGFGLFANAQEVQFLFPELRQFVGKCEYRNCVHGAEPGCAVRSAVDAGKVHASRFASYLAMLAELEALD